MYQAVIISAVANCSQLSLQRNCNRHNCKITLCKQQLLELGEIVPARNVRNPFRASGASKRINMKRKKFVSRISYEFLLVSNGCAYTHTRAHTHTHIHIFENDYDTMTRDGSAVVSAPLVKRTWRISFPGLAATQLKKAHCHYNWLLLYFACDLTARILVSASAQYARFFLSLSFVARVAPETTDLDSLPREPSGQPENTKVKTDCPLFVPRPSSSPSWKPLLDLRERVRSFFEEISDYICINAHHYAHNPASLFSTQSGSISSKFCRDCI